MKHNGWLIGALGLMMSVATVPAFADDANSAVQAKRPVVTSSSAKYKASRAPFLYAVAWQQTSAELAAISYQTYNTAERVIQAKIDGGNYKMRDGRLFEETVSIASDGTYFLESKPLAIILDLDETVFDNSTYEAFSTLQPGSYDNGYWTLFCEYQSLDARARREMPGAVNFLKKCISWGVTPIYITNRDPEDREFTIKTVQAMGIASPYVSIDEQLITRDKARDKQNAKDLVAKLKLNSDDPLAKELLGNASDKAGRRRLVEAKYKVLAWFGDNLYDHPVMVDSSLKGKEALAARDKEVDELSGRFGVDLFVLPNPTYGSWCKPLIFPHKSKSVIDTLDDAGFGEWVLKRQAERSAK